MGQIAQDLKRDLKKSLLDLEELRGEIQLKVHLAGMDAKTEWRKLEKELVKAEEDVARSATDATRAALDETIAKLKKFRESLD
jgi:predicted secreted protein